MTGSFCQREAITSGVYLHPWITINLGMGGGRI